MPATPAARPFASGPVAFDVDVLRSRFPGLARVHDGRPVVFADAPGGTQAVDAAVDAMVGYLRERNANTGGAFATSRETDRTVSQARAAAADLLGCDADEVVFGPNTTTIAFSLSRALARTLGPGDEIVLTRLDHDANVAPWLAVAEDRGATVRWASLRRADCTLDLDSLEAAVGPRTRIVAVTLASNAVGSVTNLARAVAAGHRVGAVVVGDAVHFAPHAPIDVRAMGVDVLFTSPYKYFGPHLGTAFVRREHLAEWSPYKVRPAPDQGPERWETGTQSHEALAGLRGAVDYLADVGRTAGGAGPADSRRTAVAAGMSAIRAYEGGLSARFLEGLAGLSGVRLFGIGDPGRTLERTPTFAMLVGGAHPRATAEALAARGVFVWDGNYYALEVMEDLGLEAGGGAVRIGFCHYNTEAEVDRVLADLADLAGDAGA